MQKTEAIIFDLGGVILNIDYNLTRRAFEKYGILYNFNEMYSQGQQPMIFLMTWKPEKLMKLIFTKSLIHVRVWYSFFRK